ncbi:MAG: hypothetical protein ABH817_01370 [archaeon]
METLKKVPIKVVPIDAINQDIVPDVYKAVFAGHPWHEDLVCRNCQTQYTRNSCGRYDEDRKTSQVSNDCRGGYSHRDDPQIVLVKEGNLEACTRDGCGGNVVEFYPDFCDHRVIVGEAISKGGFVGYLAMTADEKELIGFSWGYTIPEEDTKSVVFSQVGPLLVEEGIDPKKAFYAAESGIVDRFQGQGLVWPISGRRLVEARNQGCRTLVTRTINPSVHGYLRASFSGQEGNFLFKDPVRGSKWFSWDFDAFNAVEVQRRIEESLQARGGGSWTQSIH